MKQLEKSDYFDEEAKEGWQINLAQLQEIRNAIDNINDVFVYEEDIEAVCLALINLGYMKFRGD